MPSPVFPDARRNRLPQALSAADFGLLEQHLEFTKFPLRQVRWLLMAHDRADGDPLPLPHEFLSIMRGVRRAGVTVAMRALEQRGLIRPQRGRIVLLDRPGLVKLAARSYGVPETEYRRVIG